MNRTFVVLAATIFFWASAFPGIRAGLEGYSPFQLAAFRYVIASLVLVLIAIKRKIRVVDVGDVPRLFSLGLTGFTIYNLALNYGELTVTAGAASFIINTVPVFTALLSVLLLKEKVSVRGWVGMAVSFAGVSLIALGEGQGFHLEAGALLILLSAITASIYNVIQKPLLGKYSPFGIVCYAIWFGTILLLPFLWNVPERLATASLHSTLSVVYLGILPGAVAYWAWSVALSRMEASRAVTFLYLVPPVSIVVSFIWLGELPTWISLIGGILAMSGVLLVNTRSRRTHRSVANG
jgi:drug/metabolite transporter (DMT)-like permease